MARALKVFRTPIGFHDAYVAAPSQKAALEAWGVRQDLFKEGQAAVADDPAAQAALDAERAAGRPPGERVGSRRRKARTKDRDG